ncbi:hypothetical protein GIB67_032817 [Kingdonia uniflora]|uniref:Uncharacterized protein n=1 Tax=Kingdonia uniflora TaxID=39325 RepID=A0A7J7NBF0_9MAGN|nr:hypothetical protein GIB67_032817 [Kingdonia uniflora]
MSGPLQLYQLFGGGGYRRGSGGSGGEEWEGGSCRSISIMVLRSEDLSSCFMGANTKSTAWMVLAWSSTVLQPSHRIRHPAEGRLAIKTADVRERIFGLFGYDVELPMRECQLEGLDIRSRELEIGSSFVNEVSTSGQTNESDNEGEGGLEQFPNFPGQLVSYPPGSDTFREFCKAKAAIGGKWGKCVEFIGRQFRGCTYFDEDVRSDLSEGFLYFLSQLEYGLSLPLTNLANGIMNAIGACPVQMNGNMWEVITVCDHLNERWEKEEILGMITPEDVLQFYGVKNLKASGGSYFCASVTRHRFFNQNSAGRFWNDNIIWVKGNCIQRDDEEPLNLRFRSVKQSVKSTMEKKESLLDKVAEKEVELKLVLGELGLSRKKRVDSRSNKIRKAHSTRSMVGVDEGRKEISREEVRAKTPGSGS